MFSKAEASNSCFESEGPWKVFELLDIECKTMSLDHWGCTVKEDYEVPVLSSLCPSNKVFYFCFVFQSHATTVVFFFLSCYLASVLDSLYFELKPPRC